VSDAEQGFALDINEVVVRFAGLVALDRVSLTVDAQSITGVIGPNGAGKSTLMNAICGFVRVASGTIRFHGENIANTAPHRRARSGIGRTFQVPRLYRGLTLAENIEVVQSQVKRRHQVPDAAEVMTMCGVAELAERVVDRLDAGEQRFAEIARVLSMAPRLVLLDEPATGLGDAEIDRLTVLLLNVRSRFSTTVVVISHDMRVVHGACDSVSMLDFGRLIISGPPAVVSSDPHVLAAYLGEIPADSVGGI
jgi:ABC-type branched-subunit amino acid transport system ATPase component